MQETFLVHVSGETKGPYTRQQVKSMWDLGLLTADTLYWSEASAEWLLLKDGDVAEDVKIEESLPSDPPIAVEPSTSTDATASAMQRLAARFIDLQAFGFLGAYAAEPICRYFAASTSTFSGLVLTLCVTFEIAWLMLFKATTPGKWFFGLWVEPLDPKRRATAFTARTWAVIWRCFPLLIPICWPLAYRDVQRTGSTKWDKTCRTKVLYHPVEAVRPLLGALIASVLLLVSLVGIIRLLNPPAVASTLQSPAPDSTNAFNVTTTPSNVLDDKQRKSWDFVVSLWPELKDLNSPIRLEYDRLLQTDPYRDEDYPYRFASRAAATLASKKIEAQSAPVTTPSSSPVADPALVGMKRDAAAAIKPSIPGLPLGTPEEYPKLQQKCQHIAVTYFPDIAVENSPLNREFVARFKQHKASGDTFFQEPDWPIRLTEESVIAQEATAQSNDPPQRTAASPPDTSALPDVNPRPGETYDQFEKRYLAAVAELNRQRLARAGTRITNNDIIFDAFPGDNTPSTFVVSNGTDQDAIAKLIDPVNQRKILSVAVAAHQTATVEGMVSGSFRLIFAFGDTVYPNTDRFVKPGGFQQFDDLLTFTSRPSSTGVDYTRETVTLNPVPGGNAKSTAISEADFDKW